MGKIVKYKGFCALPYNYTKDGKNLNILVVKKHKKQLRLVCNIEQARIIDMHFCNRKNTDLELYNIIPLVEQNFDFILSDKMRTRLQEQISKKEKQLYNDYLKHFCR